MNERFHFQHLIDLCRGTHEELQNRTARIVDTSLAARNWLFGWYIVEFEQNGADRAELYGRRLIDRLSRALKMVEIRGGSPTNLRKFREFCQAYPKIRPTVSDESLPLAKNSFEIQQTASVESLLFLVHLHRV